MVLIVVACFAAPRVGGMARTCQIVQDRWRYNLDPPPLGRPNDLHGARRLCIFHSWDIRDIRHRVNNPETHSSPVPFSDPIYALWDRVQGWILDEVVLPHILAIGYFHFGEESDGETCILV